MRRLFPHQLNKIRYITLEIDGKKYLIGLRKNKNYIDINSISKEQTPNRYTDVPYKTKRITEHNLKRTLHSIILDVKLFFQVNAELYIRNRISKK